jgi:TonB family protein
MNTLLALSLLLSWVQVRSDTFIVKSSVGENRAKEVLRELEDFHQLVGTLVFDKVRLPELPIEVLLIGDDAQLRELAPERDGQRRPFAGYYQRGQDRDFIVLSNRVQSRTLASVVYHELTHYFLGRALADRPMWLNEGLAEYFATAEITDNSIYVGASPADRIQTLKSSRQLPLDEFLKVDQDSPHYSETSKANDFYAQAWAFVHFLQTRHPSAFKRYIDALSHGPANLFDYIPRNPRDTGVEFESYVSWFIGRASRVRVQTSREKWTMKVEPIPDAEALMSISEIFITMGRLEEARRHLEVLESLDMELPRASYYRGLLARLSDQNDEARDLFVDALMDPNLGPRAAVSLVQLGEMDIPSVRSTLRQAADARTRMPDVYWALSEIYLEDVRRVEEAVLLSTRAAPLPERPPGPPVLTAAEPVFNSYANGVEQNIRYQLLSATEAIPKIQAFVEPYYPDELLTEQLGGQVVLDLQVTEQGDVSGVWLVSSTPDVFGSLATAAVRQWKFESIPTKIRVVLDFTPGVPDAAP